jgi:hypothetical protein
VHGFESDPEVETNTVAVPAGGAGAGGGGGGSTAQAVVVTLSDARAERFPAASTASTPSVYVVPHTSPANVAVVTAELKPGAPSRYVPYAETPTLSVEAVHETATDVSMTVVRARFDGAVGGVVSATGVGVGVVHGLVLTLSVARADRLPAASYASTPSVYLFPHRRPVQVYGDAVDVATSFAPRYAP